MRFPRRPRWVPKWLVDPPHLLRLAIVAAMSVTVAVLATLAVVSTVTSYRQAQSALHTRDDAAARATARITDLSGQISDLRGRADANGDRIAQLIAEVHALEEQVRQLCGGRAGCGPVVTEPLTATGTTTTTPAPTTATVPPSPPTTAAQPPPTTTTTTPPTTAPCTTLPIVGSCVGRASRSATRTDASCGGWEDLIGSYSWSLADACRVMWCESRGDPDARNGIYHGLFQVGNGPFDPSENVDLAFSMWSERGWQPWTCKP